MACRMVKVVLCTSLLNHPLAGNGIVGAQVPVGAGLAFAQKYKGESDKLYVYLLARHCWYLQQNGGVQGNESQDSAYSALATQSFEAR